MPFSGDYQLRETGYKTWAYVPDRANPLIYVSKAGRKFVLDKPFETDGASIPRLFWWFPGLGQWDWPKAALLHDWLWIERYSGHLQVGFYESNKLLAEAIRDLGWSRLIGWTCRWAINLFGWHYWLGGEATQKEVTEVLEHGALTADLRT